MDVALRPAAMVIPADQLARLDQTACLRDEPRTVTPLEGGLTNVNLKVTTPRGRFVARLSGQTGSLLAIDRLAEYRSQVADFMFLSFRVSAKMIVPQQIIQFARPVLHRHFLL